MVRPLVVLPYLEAQVVRPLGALPFLALEVLGGRHREVQRHRLQDECAEQLVWDTSGNETLKAARGLERVSSHLGS